MTTKEKRLNGISTFSNLETARNFSNKTIKASAIVLGDDNQYWVCSLRVMTKLEKQGYSVA